jgi:nucleoside-diphosphate-sugar epimerase
MRVVITGATGNVGTSLVEQLADDDAITEIVGIARRATDWSPPKTRWVQADVAVDDLRSVFRGADAVVHLAWLFQPTHRPLVTWRANALGSIRVFEAVVSAGVRTLVYASSVGAYSPGPDHQRVDESWPTNALPTVSYGREKAYVERVLDVVARDHPDVRVVRLRPGFIFKYSSAEAQRRLFAGPLLPNGLVRSGLIPLLPDLPGLRLQALHSSDAARAYQLALTRDVRGAFNIAAEPVIDMHALGGLLRARVVRLPRGPAHAALAAAWRMHLVPASPQLLDLALGVPVMDTSRAATELGWQPQVDALTAIGSVIEGVARGAGGDTPPLRADASGPLRWREVASGVGERDDVSSPDHS